MNNKGFTLLELMIVIAIFGIFLVVAAPKMGGSKTDFKLYTIARNLVSDIRYAQELSINTRDKHGIFFSQSSYEIKNTITAKTVKTIEFNSGVSYEKIVDSSDNPVGDGVVFDSTGKPFEDDGASAFVNLSTIYLKASDVYIYIKITPETGEVSFERN